MTKGALGLQEGGWIRYSRGLITIRDRKVPEKRRCERHVVVNDEYDHLLIPVSAV